MEDIYSTKCLDFFLYVLDFTKPFRSANDTVSPYLLDGLKTLALHPNWFTTKGDYRAYYAFLDTYNAINNYYGYHGKYGKKDKELENSFKNWYNVTQQKQNIFARIFKKMNTR